MKSCFVGSSLYFKTFDKQFSGLCATCIDDTLHAKTQQDPDKSLKPKWCLFIREESGTDISLAGLKLNQTLAKLHHTKSMTFQSYKNFQ